MKMRTIVIGLVVGAALLSYAHLTLAAQPQGTDPEVVRLREEVKALEQANRELGAKLEGVRLIARKQAALARRAKLEAQAAKAEGSGK